MPIYETVFMTRQDLTETQVKDMTDGFVKIAKDGGAKIHKIEPWGLRALAYPINKNKKAHYVLIETDAPSDAVIELERNLRLNEDVLRSMTTRREKHSEGPSAVIDKSREDERPRRDFDGPRDRDNNRDAGRDNNRDNKDANKEAA